jgi:branched-chain amino acid transport system substrate-binding protein
MDARFPDPGSAPLDTESTMNILAKPLATLALTCAALPLAAQPQAPIKIGFAIAESGWMTAYDGPPHKAAMLKIEELNRQGGLLGRRIETLVADTKSEREQGAKAGESLVAQGVDLLVVSSDYDYGAPAALAARKASKLAFSLGAGDPKMGPLGVGPHVFTPNLAAQVEGITMAEWAYQQKGLRRAYVLEDQSIEYSKSGCAGFRAGWTRLAGAAGIAGSDSFKNADASIASQISRLRALSPAPDAIYLCTYNPGGASAIRQLRAAGIALPILANVGMTDAYWLSAVPQLSDFYVPTYMSIFGDDPRPAIGSFLAAFTQRYGARPESAYAVLGYSMVEQWAIAVQRAGSTAAAAVTAELEKFREEALTIGPTSYSRELHIQVDRPLLIMEVQNGKNRAIEVWRNTLIPSTQLLFRMAAKP